MLLIKKQLLLGIPIILVIAVIVTQYATQPSSDHTPLEQLKYISLDCPLCEHQGHCRSACANACTTYNRLFETFSIYNTTINYSAGCPCYCAPAHNKNQQIIIDALSDRDSEKCAKMKSGVGLHTRDFCYIVLSLYLEDITLCERVEQVSLQNSRDACYLQHALATRDISVCDKITLVEGLQDSQLACKLMVPDPSAVPYMAIPR